MRAIDALAGAWCIGWGVFWAVAAGELIQCKQNETAVVMLVASLVNFGLGLALLVGSCVQ